MQQFDPNTLTDKQLTQLITDTQKQIELARRFLNQLLEEQRRRRDG